ncbi:hypothetical protein J3A83DRAFT_4189821 [Scleroderma citrinum]
MTYIRSKIKNLEANKTLKTHEWVRKEKGYQKAVDKVMEILTEEEKAEAEELAKEWNEQHPPPDLQAKNAKKKSQQYAEEFAKEMWKQCGARVVHCWQKFVQYSRITFDTDDDGKESNTNNEPRHLVRKSKARPQVSLSTHDDGTPYIPSILDMHVLEMKDIMRAFVTFHYSLWPIIMLDEVTRMLELWRDEKENNPDNILMKGGVSSSRKH